MPTLSVAAPQLRSISLELAAVAVSVPGAVGGWVSTVLVVPLAVLPYGPGLLEVSTARTS